jgi:hypothetical protein
LWLAAVCVAAVGSSLWLRVHNAVTYPLDWGFDAKYNWRYIIALSRNWHLPAPDAGWSTADPPLYFGLSALLVRMAPDRLMWVAALNVVLGFAIAAMAVALVRRLAPETHLRAWLAGGLVLFLPAHILMSAMVNEEMLTAACVSALLLLLADPSRREEPPTRAIGRGALAGIAGGLAWFSKFTGAIGIAVAALTLADDARRRSSPVLGLRVLGALGVAVLAMGGWFYLRNVFVYGYLQPYGLPAHQMMFEMPPGARGVLDYLRFPLTTFTDPQLLNPDLLRSVWGSLYASVWFDAHRSFLPTDSDAVRQLGSVTLVLALLPTAAFIAGFARAVPRALRGDPIDGPLVALTLLTFAGFAYYTWRNPWFAVIKGTSLLSLCLPYAVYASESLTRWGRRPAAAAGLAAVLLALAACVVVSGTFNGWFVRDEVSGLPWRSIEAQ